LTEKWVAGGGGGGGGGGGAELPPPHPLRKCKQQMQTNSRKNFLMSSLEELICDCRKHEFTPRWTRARFQDRKTCPSRSVFSEGTPAQKVEADSRARPPAPLQLSSPISWDS